MADQAARPIDVAVGILVNAHGDVLLGQRPAGKPYAGYWEFPGGKVESGESIEHAHVRLHFFISHDWRGEPQSLEGQAFAWQGTVGVEPLLPATIPLLEWLDAWRAEAARNTKTPEGQL